MRCCSHVRFPITLRYKEGHIFRTNWGSSWWIVYYNYYFESEAKLRFVRVKNHNHIPAPKRRPYSNKLCGNFPFFRNILFLQHILLHLRVCKGLNGKQLWCKAKFSLRYNHENRKYNSFTKCKYGPRRPRTLYFPSCMNILLYVCPLSLLKCNCQNWECKLEKLRVNTDMELPLTS